MKRFTLLVALCATWIPTRNATAVFCETWVRSGIFSEGATFELDPPQMVADLDGDGQREIVVIQPPGSGPNVFIYGPAGEEFRWSRGPVGNVNRVAFVEWDGDPCREIIIGGQGGFALLEACPCQGFPVAVPEEEAMGVPVPILNQNTPNPFNPQTTIEFTISEAEHVTLNVYDPAGRLVRRLLDERRDPGSYKVVWDGRNDSGGPAASGTYFYELRQGKDVITKKAVVLK